MRGPRTIARGFHFEGIGLHTGCFCRVRVLPASPGSGISFFRTDLQARIPLSPDSVTSTTRGTTLSGEKGATVHTIEHFLASVAGAGIDNLRVEMDSDEMPILDGSADYFSSEFTKAGWTNQEGNSVPLIVTEPLELKFGEVMVKAEPADGLILDVLISFPYPGLEEQRCTFALEDGSFARELAKARTFCFEEEVEQLRSNGLIKGGNLNCAVVIGEKGILNGPLRFSDEFVRHKTLDLLGDLMLLNRPLRAKVTARKAGHKTHLELVKALVKRFSKEEGRVNSKPNEPKTLDIVGIQGILPHRYPFLLVDRVLEVEPYKRLVAIKNVTANEAFFQGHFPGHPIMPGVLVIEAMAQAGGICFLCDDHSGKMLYLAGVDKARFRKPVMPGDQIRFEIDVLQIRSKIGKIAGKAIVDGQVACEAELTCAIIDRNDEKGAP